MGASKRRILKIWLMIRLTTVILIATLLQVSAASLAQRVTIDQKKTTLAKVFREIHRQTGYDFLYAKGLLDQKKLVDIKAQNEPLELVLEKVLFGQSLSYSIEQKMIVIKEKSIIAKVLDYLDQIDIRGKVVDEQGQPIAGATIKVMGSSLVTSSNEAGIFTLKEVAGDAILEISYVGYTTRALKVAKDMGVVKMEMSIGKLDEVTVNAGYYTVTERERTGSISKVTAATIEKQPVNNPLMALQGRVPGMEITQLTGMPGGGFKVQIRGRNSINTAVGNDPLYIVDGVPYPVNRVSSNTSSAIFSAAGASPLSFINPFDIQHIEILKDADATAIYGSRGANGVVLITTKKGQSGDAKVNVSVNQGYNEVGHRIDLLNTPQYIKMRQDAFKNAAATPTARDYDVNGSWDMNRYTDWQKELIGGSANTTNAMLNISGGNQASNYLLGANYYSEGTVFPGELGLDRAGIHFGLNIGSVDNRFTGSFLANYSHTKTNLLRVDLTNWILLPPNAPSPYDQYGELNWENNTVYLNPFAQLFLTNNAVTDNLIANLNLNYRLIDKLMFKISAGYTGLKRAEQAKTPLISRSTALASTATNRIADFSNNYNHHLIVEPQIAYNRQFSFGKFEALLGGSLQANESEIQTIRGTGFNSDDLMGNIGSAATLTTPQISYLQYRYNSLFGRLNYNVDGKYIVNLTARRDGSSRFGEGKQFANFGAIGGAWIFSDEKIIKDKLSFLSFGKLRASFGITGNDQIADYGYLQSWSSLGTYQGISTLYPQRIANPEYGWETNKKTEFGIQLGIFRDTVNLEVSHYQNISSNQLVGYPLPLSTGNATIQMNLPATVRNSGWEVSAQVKILDRSDWNWLTSINLTVPKNKLVSYPGGLENSPYALNYVIGQPLAIRKIYNVTGVNSQTGLYEIEDKNGNGVLDNDDRYLNKFIGQYYYGGLNNSIQFRGVSLDFLFSFNKQNGLSYMNGSSNPGFFDYVNPINNQLAFVLDNDKVQRPSSVNAAFVQFLNARENGGENIVDASFIRLKNVSLTYDVPNKWLSELKIASAKISLQGQNLYTWTNYLGLDPETQRMQGLPPLRALSLGLNLSF